MFLARLPNGQSHIQVYELQPGTRSRPRSWRGNGSKDAKPGSMFSGGIAAIDKMGVRAIERLRALQLQEHFNGKKHIAVLAPA